MLPNFQHKKNEIRHDVITMIQIIREAFTLTFGAIEHNEIEKIANLHQTRLGHLSYLANSIDNNVVVALALHAPEAGELRDLIALLKSTANLTRMGASAKSYAKRMKEVIEKGVGLEFTMPFIIQLHKIVLLSLDQLESCVNEFNMELYRSIVIEEEKSDEVSAIIQKEILDTIMKDSQKAPELIKTLGAVSKLERAVDQVEGIVNLLLYAKEGGRIEVNN